ncbi:hypothetical protein DFJ58DRAFT_790184, partial [Suillus subalutaceus]|uniref:uncharacterized protein n=1 Tax=Suillus subalutaceus TaxID=48586 RepID=UPI001B8832D5
MIRRICVGLTARYVLCLLTCPFSLGIWSDQFLTSAVIGVLVQLNHSHLLICPPCHSPPAATPSPARYDHSLVLL